MTETKTGADPEAGRVQSIAAQLDALKTDILGAVREMVAPLREGGSAQQAAQHREEQHLERGSNLADQIDAAVAKVLAGRDAEQAKADRDAKVDKLIEASAEKPPVERKRVHRVMGWGEPAS